MFNNFFKPTVGRTSCNVFYTFEYDREKTLELFEYTKHYLCSQLEIEFTFASFFNESYVVKYGKAEDIELKLKKERANDLANFSLHTNDLRKELSDVNIEFNFTRPIQLTLQIPEKMNFDLLGFVNGMISYFCPQYGFVYNPVFDKWSTAYANGDQQHVRSEKGYESFEKMALKRWFNECEKISSGYIRDIFETNFINERHLEFLIKGECLKYIITTNNLGNLEQIHNGVYFWNLNKEQIRQARLLLYDTGILI